MTELDLEKILAGVNDPVPEGHRAGIIGLVGRPNTGKSTLLNTLLGAKVAIVTPVAGTTRTTIRGALTRPTFQAVFVDTPGVTKPQTLLAQRLNDRVRQTWAGMDALLLLIDAKAGVGRGDRYLAEQVLATGVPVIAVANKIDAFANAEQTLPVLEAVAALDTDRSGFVAVVPVSAKDATNTDRLVDVIASVLPESPRIVSHTMVHDQTEEQFAAEVLREQLIARAKQELPHSIAVVVETLRVDDTNDELLHIDADIYVERDSQKGIVIGKGGDSLKQPQPPPGTNWNGSSA